MHIKNDGNHLYISRAICVLVVFSPNRATCGNILGHQPTCILIVTRFCVFDLDLSV